MDSEQLKYISYLTQTTSLTKVAEHFFTSHQVVKKSIANLEEELQVTLLQSTNQGSHLTPAGLCVAKHAQQFQQQYTAMLEDLQEFQVQPEEILDLHLYVTPNMATEYYLDLYDSFFENKENINLILHSSTFPQMLKESTTTKNNLYLTPISNTSEMQQLLEDLLHKYQMTAILFPPATNYLCMHKTSRYVKLNALSFSDLKDTPTYVFLNTNPLCLSDDDPGIALQYFSDYTILKRNIKKNHAVGIIKKYEFNHYFGENNSEYILRPLKDTEINHVAIVTQDILDNNPIIKEFIHYLQGKFQE